MRGRTIVSGLTKYVPIQSMAGRSVVVVCNLKPRNMRGVTSAGMILCASNADHTEVSPISPPEGCEPGESITFAGHTLAPVDAGNRATKAFEKCAEHLFVDENGLATYSGIPFMTSKGPVTSSLKGKIS